MVLLAAACAGGEAARPDPTTPVGYVEAVLGTLRDRALRAAQVDWAAWSERARRVAGEADSVPEVYPVVRDLLGALGDRHSSFLTPSEAARWRSSSEADGGDAALGPPFPEGRVLDGALGYVSIPLFNSGSARALEAFADTLQGVVASVDAAAPCGWVVDLRRDMGGNVWPMLAGIGPVLGEGIAGHFVEPSGRRESWEYRDGAAILDGRAMTRVSGAPHELSRTSPPVAVLQGPMTASSGEAVLVSFLGRPGTRSFGMASAGLSTKNTEIDLPDGGLVFLTTARYGDRTGNVYGERIEPGETVVFDWEADHLPDPDPVLERAIAWLLEQPTCR